MSAEIIRTANPQKTARRELIFLLIFMPIFLTGSCWAMNHFGVESYFQFMCILIGILVSVILAVLQVRIFSSKGPQEWKLVNGRLIYNSPTTLFGKSFDVAWREVVRIYPVDEGGFVRCDLTDVDFHIGEPSGWEFFNLIKDLKKAEQAG